MATHTIQTTYNGSASRSTTQSFTGSGAISISESVSNGGTDVQINVAMDVSALKSVWINSDQAVTLETNSGSAADETISLLANQPYIWYTGSYFTNLLATDITAIFITNASGATATIQIEATYDATP